MPGGDGGFGLPDTTSPENSSSGGVLFGLEGDLMSTLPLTVPRSSRGLPWPERHLVAQPLQPAYQAAGLTFHVQLVEVAGAHLPVGGLVLQQVVDDDQDGMAQRHQRPLLAAPAGQALVLRRRVRPL